MSETTIVMLVIGAVLVGGYIWYISLIGRRNKALEALSSIDVQLRKRHDLLPNILKLASRFMKHERELLDRLTALRAKAQQDYHPQDPDAVQNHLQSESELQSGILQFFAVAENYPELKSHETIVRAQDTFAEVEGHISAARRFYNSAVTDLNNAVQIFPGSMIATMTGVKTMPYFEIEEAARKPVDASAYLD
ncbi:LemA family protein [Aestuariispira insulae]|uniref:LemA protein n=1 Tax=Aestuariispira insulae TaxID=1461337 RepID=A0A3D9H9J6_9PROT|nr:LemA family protein [Aestuariispira insulae]RED46157.1 LemA protein [Aestuariispira insulae]